MVEVLVVELLVLVLEVVEAVAVTGGERVAGSLARLVGFLFFVVFLVLGVVVVVVFFFDFELIAISGF